MTSPNSSRNGSSRMSCITCDIEFEDNLNAFIDHMTESHSDDGIQCTHCGEVSSTGAEYAMHFIYSHTGTNNDEKNQNSVPKDFSLPSPSGNDESYDCPNCPFRTRDPAALTSHFDNAHVESKMEEQASCSQSSSCPVCCELFPVSDLNAHVNSHFDQDVESDRQLALELEQQERETRLKAEAKEFEVLKKEYGMDESGSYNQQGLQALNQAYGKGQLTLGQLYDAKLRLSMNQHAGVEDPNYPTKNPIDRIKELSRRCADVLDVHFCTAMDHYSSCQADFGFGCGYRNIQMILSSLKHCDMYRKALWENGPVNIPSIPKIQELIENAWQLGFDARGCAQLNGRLKNTRKWIGATEAAVLFQFHRIRVQLVDVHVPTGPKSTHPLMLRWCYDYFKEGTAKGVYVAPLYLQHEGHSRTIIGVERTRSGQFRLLVVDPSHSRQRMQQLANSSNTNELKLIRKSANDLTKPKYQLVVVRGVMESDQQYQWFKNNFDHVKIPAN